MKGIPVESQFVHRDRCEICGSSDKAILISRPFTAPAIWDFLERYYASRVDKNVLADAPYEVARCTQCGFMWQTYILNDHWMEVLYSQWILASGSLEKKRQSNLNDFARYAREAYVIGRQIDKPPHLIRVLDYGMGWGYWCLMAKAFGYEAYGVELSQERIDFARENGIQTLDLSTLDGPYFDFINCEQTFEHIPRPLDQLKQLARVLNPGGILRIAVPNAAGKEAAFADPAWQPSKDAFHPLEHINSFTHQTLHVLARQAGLRVIPSPILPKFFPSPRQWIGERILKSTPWWVAPTTVYLTQDKPS